MTAHRNPNRILAFAFALITLGLLAAAPSQAQVTVTKPSFTITFAAGWDTLPYNIGGDTNMFILMNETKQAEAWGVANQGGQMGADAFIKAMAQVWANGFAIVDSGTTTLGGRAFKFVEMWDSANGDSSSHIRFYATAAGGTMFVLWTAFSMEERSAVITDVENALKGMNLVASAAVRRLAGLRRLDPALQIRDVLGRALPPVTQKLPRTPLYQRAR